MDRSAGPAGVASEADLGADGTAAVAPQAGDGGASPAAPGPRAVLVVNADDFGASAAVNAAVARAHRSGVLSSASLMVTGDAVDEAVAIARANPGLAVGLHLVLVKGRAVSSPAAAPRLVDALGRLPTDPARFGLRLAFDGALQREVAGEIAAQLDRFLATGLPLSHVDGHLNFHLHPAVFTRLARAGAARGARGIRLPRDDLGLALRHDRRRLLSKLLLAAAFGALSAWARRRLPPGMHAADRVYGLFQSGNLTRGYVLDAIAGLRRGSAELYAHPSVATRDAALGPNRTDLETLCDPAVAAALARGGVRVAGYADLDAA